MELGPSNGTLGLLVLGDVTAGRVYGGLGVGLVQVNGPVSIAKALEASVDQRGRLPGDYIGEGVLDPPEVGTARSEVDVQRLRIGGSRAGRLRTGLSNHNLRSESSLVLTMLQAWTIMQTRAIWRENTLEPDQVARMAVEVASEKQAEDIVMLDIRQVSGFADYFVIMSAESVRQLEALQEDLVKALKNLGIGLHHREGTAKSGWILLDYSNVIIHMFGAEERTYYRLEQLWAGASQVVRVL